MSACERLRPAAAGIAALPDSDPERQHFLAHAAGCPGCLQALRESEAMLKLLDQTPPSAPRKSALLRASRQIVSELVWLQRQPGVRAGAVVAGWLLLVFLARHRASEGWAFSIALAGAAALVAAFLDRLAAAGVALLLAGAAAALSGSGTGLAPQLGLACLLDEQLGAAFCIGVVFWLARRTGTAASRSLVPAAAAGALAGEAGLYLTCPARNSAGHVWLFHFGGVVLAALVALAWARLNAGRAATAPQLRAPRA